MSLSSRSFPLRKALSLLLLGSAIFQAVWLILRWGTPGQVVWCADLMYLIVVYLGAARRFTVMRTRSAGQRRAAGLLTAALLALPLRGGESLWAYFDLFNDQSSAVSATTPSTRCSA